MLLEQIGFSQANVSQTKVTQAKLAWAKKMTGLKLVVVSLSLGALVVQPQTTLAADELVGPGYDFSGGSARYQHYYIGVDGRPTVLTGTYAGLANPNFGRLTFLFAHVEEVPSTNHFHGIGAYSYTGPVSAPVVVSTNTNNRIPEVRSGEPPLTLVPGTGVFEGLLISKPGPSEYSNLIMTPLAKLLSYAGSDPGDGAQLLYNSSGNRWNGSLAGANVALEVVDLTPGLQIASSSGQTVLGAVGDVYNLGQGDNFAFRPVFWVHGTAPLGTYSAAFRLRDLRTSNAFGDSGTFRINVQAAPEPSTMLGLGVFGAIVGLARRRQAKATQAKATH